MFPYLVIIAELSGLYLSSVVFTRLFSLLFSHFSQNRSLLIALYALLFLPGTLIHELAHFFAAGLLGVPIGEVTIIPEISEDEIHLGGVSIGEVDPIRRGLVGLAPMIFGSALILGLVSYLSANNFSLPFWQVTLCLYLIFEISNTMFSSRRDLAHSFELLVGIFVLVLTLGFLIFWLHLKLFDVLAPAGTALLAGSRFLLFPLAIDAALIILLLLLIKLSKRKIHG